MEILTNSQYLFSSPLPSPLPISPSCPYAFEVNQKSGIIIFEYEFFFDKFGNLQLYEDDQKGKCPTMFYDKTLWKAYTYSSYQTNWRAISYTLES